MKAKQLSVFLENKSGRLTEVTEALGRLRYPSLYRVGSRQGV